MLDWLFVWFFSLLGSETAGEAPPIEPHAGVMIIAGG